MKSRFLTKTNDNRPERNIYADRSALILDWLLREGLGEDGFTLRRVANEANVSIGLVQRVLQTRIRSVGGG